MMAWFHYLVGQFLLGGLIGLGVIAFIEMCKALIKWFSGK